MNRKLLLTIYNERKLAILVEEGKITEVHPEPLDNGPRTGEIYLGTVKKVVASQAAAYLDIGRDDLVYMNLKSENVRPGMQFPVQVRKEAAGLKKAVVKQVTVSDNDRLPDQKLHVRLLSPKEPFRLAYAKGTECEIVTDSGEIFAELNRCGILNCRLYEDEKVSLSTLYGIPACIEGICQKRVWLKDGGFLVIEPTEALTVIDVNSGKAIRGKDKETSIYKVNLEAAKEIAYQLRLRNLSGIILVDFINMKDKERKEAFLQVFREELKKDPVPVHFIDETALQLTELTRTRREPPVCEMLGKYSKRR